MEHDVLMPVSRAYWLACLSLMKSSNNSIAREYHSAYILLSYLRLPKLILGRSSVEWHIQEGATFEPVKHCATVRGPVRKVLLGERVALNTLARCSGIATK